MSEQIWSRLGLTRQEAEGGATDLTRSQYRFPNTLRTVFPDGQGQSAVFDPALLHFPNAYRAGDLRFDDAEAGARWLAARRAALDVVLEAVASSAWANDLVLRGSALMSSWFPESAREPGDLDFVVHRTAWELTDPLTDEVFTTIARGAEQISSNTDIKIHARHAVSDDIWTYDRVPGRRLMLPWTEDGVPGGWVQLDFVFGEHLSEDPQRAHVSLGSGRPGTSMLTASKQLSLAWKLCWLLSDMHPQGKDLYDAVLLAEDVQLDRRVLRDALQHTDKYYRFRAIGLTDIAQLEVEPGWAHFQGEYPHVTGSAERWTERLCAALTPTFTLLNGKPASAYELDADWLAPTVAEVAAVTSDRAAGLQNLLADRRIGFAQSALITRELVGRELMSVAEAVRVVVSTESRWADDKVRYNDLALLERKAHAYGLDLRTPWPERLAAAPIVHRIRELFPDHAAYIALEILAPLATDPDPRLSAESVLTAAVELSEGRVELLHYAIQRARTDPSEVQVAAARRQGSESTRR